MKKYLCKKHGAVDAIELIVDSVVVGRYCFFCVNAALAEKFEFLTKEVPVSEVRFTITPTAKSTP